MRVRIKHVITYVICIAIPVAAGIISAFFTSNNMMIFAELNKPPLAPPAWLFPVAWTVLYILMGIASARVVLSGHEKTTQLIELYFAQLVLNFLWSIIFFNLSMYYFAAIWLFVMWLLIVIFTVKSRKVDMVAFCCFIPYVLWCTFALYLNIGVAMLN